MKKECRQPYEKPWAESVRLRQETPLCTSEVEGNSIESFQELEEDVW